MLSMAVTGCQDKPPIPVQTAEAKPIPEKVAEKVPVVTVTQRDAERAFDEQKADIAPKEKWDGWQLIRVKTEKPLIGDINHDGKADALVAYVLKDGEQHSYSMYAVFLHDGKQLRYQSSFYRGKTGGSEWDGGDAQYPSHITFLSVKDDAVQAEERSPDKHKRVLQENYYFHADKLLSADEVAYLKSDRQGFFDLNGDELALNKVIKRFGQPVKINKEQIGCGSFFDEEGMQDYEYKNAVFEVWQGKAGFAGMTAIPKDVRFVLRGLTVTADMTEQTFREKTGKDPRFSVYTRPAEETDLPGTMYFVEQSTEVHRWIFTFNQGKLSAVAFTFNRC